MLHFMKIIKTAIVSLSNDFEYFAEVIKYSGRYFYQVENITIEINQLEYNRMVSVLWHQLYYFSTSLRLHFLIEHKKKILIG